MLADAHGRVVASVPRCRERVDSGVSVAGRTVHDAQLERLGAAVAEATGLTYIANVQFRRDAAGQPALLEVNPRVPGALPLTMASGVDMPRMAMDSLRGRPLPEHADFRDMAMVRFLEERFIELGRGQRGGGVTVPLSLDDDHHVHSSFSDDAVSTVAENVAAARRARAARALPGRSRAPRLGVGAGLPGRRGQRAPRGRARRAGGRGGQDPGPGRAA